MLRRNLLRSLMATPLAGWLRPWMPLSFGGAGSQEVNAAAIYRKAFGWAEGLRSEDLDLLRGAATIALDERRIVALTRQARPALKAIREAAAIDRCCWGAEIISPGDLGKDHLDV